MRPSTNDLPRTVLAVLFLGLLIVGVFWVLRPFLAALLWGAMIVIATWPLREASDNYPMAFDEEHQRLLVGCRTPARLLVIDTDPSSPKAGKAVAAIPISGDVDDIWIDAPAKRIYLSCGEGFVDVVEQAGNQLVVARTPKGRPATWYAGSGWYPSGYFPDVAAWDRHLDDFAARLRSPLNVEVLP